MIERTVQFDHLNPTKYMYYLTLLKDSNVHADVLFWIAS